MSGTNGTGSGGKDQEPELELDLESLGLEDREIPPEKLTKLEKIGSGGFKDVFIGKLKGRRVAISEFRGQLSAMDIKELKLLGGFDHPNIVRFVSGFSIRLCYFFLVTFLVCLCSLGLVFLRIRARHQS
jgi:serine/threonine protein kinase